MVSKNNSILAVTIRKLSPVIENIPIEEISSDFVWSIVLGVLPVKYKGLEKRMMEQSRKDSTEEKIDNVEKLTEYAAYFLKEKPDFRYENIESFSLAFKQLIIYTSGDSKAEASLNDLKDLYISFITSYYIESVKTGRYKTTIQTIRYFCDKIFIEDKDLKTRLYDIIS